MDALGIETLRGIDKGRRLSLQRIEFAAQKAKIFPVESRTDFAGLPQTHAGFMHTKQ